MQNKSPTLPNSVSSSPDQQQQAQNLHQYQLQGLQLQIIPQIYNTHPVDSVPTELYLNQILDVSNNQLFVQNLTKNKNLKNVNGCKIDQLQIQIKTQANFVQKEKETTQGSQKTNCVTKVKKNKKIVLGIVIFFILLCATSIGVGISISKIYDKEQEIYDDEQEIYDDEQEIYDEEQDNTIVIYSCVDNPQCVGVPANVANYIITRYSQIDQIRSLLQVSRSLGSISSNYHINLTQDQFVSSYRNITKSVQCMALNLPNDYKNIFETITQLQFDTQQSISRYINMNEAFSGQPLILTSDANLTSTCQFNLTASRRRLEQTSNTPLQSSNSSQDNVVFNYISAIGQSPSALVYDITKTKSILLGNSTINFNVDFDVVALGAQRTNGTDGFLKGIVTSYRTMLQQNGQSAPNQLDLLFCLRMILNIASSSRNLPRRISIQVFKRFRRYFVQQAIESFINNQTEYNTAKHAQFIIKQLDEGKKVVLLAHAEGTLYANKVYKLLTSAQKQAVSLVFVAPAASSMADGRANYMTNPSDNIISAMRTIALTGRFPPPLTANMNAVTFSSDLDFDFNHDLQGYADAYTSILSDLILSLINRTTNGSITVTLTWDMQPDIDLHIFEPNFHVYFSSRIGQNGFLDTDDTNGYGPEHYYAHSTIQQGNYTVRANYFAGSAPSTAIATVEAGPQFYRKIFTLDTAIGFSGINLPPYFICTIMVSINAISGQYEYEIIHD